MVEPASAPLFVAGNWLRQRVVEGLEAGRATDPAALVAGFLIGDVRALSATATDTLRRAGLSHFIAVSGSNVALFLVAWWLLAAPLTLQPRRRAVLGLAGLALFVVVTRWEPSVLRAAAMAALLLVGRAVGIPLGPWAALGAAVGGLLLLSGELVGDVGFQLSVSATAGVLAGARVLEGWKPRWVATLLGATLSAQVAVAPLLLLHFGSVPLLAPLSNLLAAPLVILATITGGIGLLVGVPVLVRLAVGAAGLVLDIASWASPWPQLGPLGCALAVLLLALATRPRLRPGVTVLATFALALFLLGPVGSTGPPTRPVVVFLDVGQGDAVLLRGPMGETVLIDGGPETSTILTALRGRGVRRIELAVLSHPHQDHLSGLLAVLERLPVDRLWHPGVEAGEPLDRLLETAGQRQVVVEVPSPGWRAAIGSFSIRVVGPLRRYQSPNDQSLVLLAEANGMSVLLPGDIEAVAQQELGPLPADVMKVPHQGAATSDAQWLAESAGAVAVISVGPNTYGHPSQDVVDVLTEAGASVLRTDVSGDIELVFDPAAAKGRLVRSR